jgi:hypothetical protein
MARSDKFDGVAQRLWVRFLDNWASVVLPALRVLGHASNMLGKSSGVRSVRPNMAVQLADCQKNLVEQSKLISTYAVTDAAGPLLVHTGGSLRSAQVLEKHFFSNNRKADLFPDGARWIKGVLRDLLHAADLCGEAIQVCSDFRRNNFSDSLSNYLQFE